MASLVIVAVLCLVGSALSAPQQDRERRQILSASPLVQPQLVQQGAYLQPQLIRGAYARPQGLPLARRVALQYAQPSPNIVLAPQAAPAVRTVPIAAPQIIRQGLVSGVSRTPAILRQVQDVSFDGTYTYGFESEDGIAVQASAGPLTAVGPEEAVQTVTGSFSYTAPDGTPITTNWIADENGFRAEGAHLPRGPLNA